MLGRDERRTVVYRGAANRKQRCEFFMGEHSRLQAVVQVWTASAKPHGQFSSAGKIEAGKLHPSVAIRRARFDAQVRACPAGRGPTRPDFRMKAWNTPARCQFRAPHR
jgi:hypothetical protein